MERTQGKFYYSPEKMLNGWRIMKDGQTIAITDSTFIENFDDIFKNAEMICNALNQNSALLEALKEVYGYWKDGFDKKDEPYWYKKAEQAIKKVEG